MDSSQRDFAAIAERYTKDIITGKIIAGEWTKKACRRQQEERKRPFAGDWPYKFDKERANRVCRFIELLPHIKGDWASRGLKLRLEPWQIFIYTTVFGWVYRKGFVDQKTGRDLSGKRRFRFVYLEMARKNGKSTMSAPVGLYMTCADAEAGAEVYSAATKQDQARVAVWDPAKNMVEREPGLRRKFGIETSAHSIFREESFFKPLSSEAKSLDALNIHCAIIDELHAHRTRHLYDVLESARGSRLQPLLWMITTAGYDRSGICYEHHTYVKKILDGTGPDDTYFGMIFALDKEDDWQDETLWIKANPNLDVSVYSNELKPEARKAARIPSALNGFLTKHLCVWVNASENLFNLTQWNSLADPSLVPEDFLEDPCWLGLDFAPRNDITDIILLFRREVEGEAHYYVFARHYLSEGKVEESENASYAGWAHAGLLRTNPGNETDERIIAQELIDICFSGYQIQELDCDYSRVQGIQHKVKDEVGLSDDQVVDIPQNPKHLCPPTERLSALIASGKIHHTGDPVLAWMLSNVIGKPKGNWGLYPDKERYENKIDGVQALLTALSRAMVMEPEESEFDVVFLGAQT
jgi:phage terminase large subunit-like protein